jgi:hypothetical protein
VTANPPPAKDTRTRVRSLVEEELERVKTLEDSEAVIRRAEQLAASKTEAQAGKRRPGIDDTSLARLLQYG